MTGTERILQDPEDYAEALAWFNECRARRARDRERRIELEANVLSLAARNAEQEAELEALKALVDMLERGGVRIVSAGGSYTLAEFRDGIAKLAAREAGES